MSGAGAVAGKRGLSVRARPLLCHWNTGLEYGANANDDECEAECDRRYDSKCLGECHVVLLMWVTLKRLATPNLDAPSTVFFFEKSTLLCIFILITTDRLC